MIKLMGHHQERALLAGPPPPDSHLFRTSRDSGGAHLAVEALHQLPRAIAHQGGTTEDLNGAGLNEIQRDFKAPKVRYVM